MTVQFDATAAREALARLPELAAQEDLTPPHLGRMYVPALHLKALHLDASVVVGMRGAGKSWWTAVLASETHRQFVSTQLRSSSLARLTARVGFGLDDTEKDFPRPEALSAFLTEGMDPVDIWQTIVLRHALVVVGHDAPFPETSWRERVRWLAANRDMANALLGECDDRLSADNRVLLIVFDAFDRLAATWAEVRALTSGALKVGLRLRSRRSLRTKFFIRPDLEEDDEVWRFPDSSKLRHAKVDLVWTSGDLYGLIFVNLANDSEFGPAFRSELTRTSPITWRDVLGVVVPSEEIVQETFQRPIIEALADRNMGGGPKRGYTYSWVPLHLADAKGRISPRSYLLAFKRAAEDTANKRPDHRVALYYGSIQQGVVRASEVRVDEISEDYPWVRPLLQAAQGSVVPMSIAEIASRWSGEAISEMTKVTTSKLPPRRFTSDPFRKQRPDALIDDLVDLGVLYRTTDGRLNVPDIFRVGFGIRRKGGVKPPR
jgi:hypothetical protein